MGLAQVVFYDRAGIYPCSVPRVGLVAGHCPLLAEFGWQMKVIHVLRGITLALAICVIAVAWQAHRQVSKGDEFWLLGSFDFLASAGGHVTDRDLSGKVCIFGCFFTCCTTQCPALTSSMARLQNDFKDLADVRLISLTVDPEHDTPEKLAAYASTFSADPKRWLFLTGDRAVVESFVTKQLKLGMEKKADAEPGDKVLHSEKLTLVDRNGQVRGFFNGIDADELDKLRQAVRQIHR
jgi:cytochrome oxidase Cu insertion factor (SCO1/SenC/PrrC family)